MRFDFVLLLALLPVFGCQSYKPIPLQQDAVLADWHKRSPSLPLVKDFAAEQARITGVASVFDPTDGISLAEAETLTILFNPSLRTSRLIARVAKVGSTQAGRWEDPRFGIDAERIISGASDPWVIGGLLNLTVPLSGRLEVEKNLAVAQADSQQLMVLDQERSVLSDLRKRWVDWSASTQQVRVIEQAIADLTVISSASAKLRDAGEIDPTEARLFDIDLVRRQGQLISAQHEAAQLEAELKELMGISPAANFPLLPSMTLEQLEVTLPATQHVKVQIVRSQYAVAEKALELEIRKQYPDIDIGGGFGTDEGDSRILGGISLPLPLLNGNRRNISEAAAQRDAIRASFEEQLIATESAILQTTAKTSGAAKKLNHIEHVLIPLVDRQQTDARRLLDIGEFNPLLFREAIDSAADAKLDLLAARVALAHAMATQRYWSEPTFSSPAIKETP